MGILNLTRKAHAGFRALLAMKLLSASEVLLVGSLNVPSRVSFAVHDTIPAELLAVHMYSPSWAGFTSSWQVSPN